MDTLDSGVVRNLIGGVYVLTNHCNFKTTCVNVPHVNKTVTGLGVYIPIIPPVATPLIMDCKICNPMIPNPGRILHVTSQLPTV